MIQKWEKFVAKLKDDSAKVLKDELKALILNAKDDKNDFLNRQGEKLELYLNQLAGGHITLEQFEGYVMDIRDLTELRALKMSVAAKAGAQRFAKGVTQLILKGLVALL